MNCPVCGVRPSISISTRECEVRLYAKEMGAEASHREQQRSAVAHERKRKRTKPNGKGGRT